MKNKAEYMRTDAMKRLFLGKDLLHRERAKLSFEEKIEVLIRLQQLANDIKLASGRNPAGRIWKI